MDEGRTLRLWLSSSFKIIQSNIVSEDIEKNFEMFPSKDFFTIIRVNIHFLLLY